METLFSDFTLSLPFKAQITELLKSQGINFDKNLKEGIDSVDFAALMLKSGLLGSHSAFTWVTFHGAYDIAHLMKILIQQPLSYDLMGFMNLV
ncbi:putative ccr4-associated factor 1 like protein 11 [Quercus suber]|uniref:Ccr4-associated factor 1 like protein 11 n=1 Tax=Quercus suber TaxID=58331 RepID=A0AAW0J3K9_QUESU